MVSIKLKNSNLSFEEIECVILDKDGTITDSHYYWSEIIIRRSRMIIETLNLDQKCFELIASSMGLNTFSNKLSNEGPIALKSREEVIRIVCEKLNKKNIKINNNQLSKIFLKVHEEFTIDAERFIKPIVEACKFIKICRRKNLKLVLISSDTELNTKRMVEILDLEGYFDLIIGGDSGFDNKSKGFSSKYACKELGISAKNTISIGDAFADFEMAENANLKGCVLVATGQIPIERLLEINHFCIKTLDEVLIN
tara:strand:+ start:389 stop:1150 length:762 start_codon:yes stop_codon:yes gene_type:complete